MPTARERLRCARPSVAESAVGRLQRARHPWAQCGRRTSEPAAARILACTYARTRTPAITSPQTLSSRLTMIANRPPPQRPLRRVHSHRCNRPRARSSRIGAALRSPREASPRGVYEARTHPSPHARRFASTHLQVGAGTRAWGWRARTFPRGPTARRRRQAGRGTDMIEQPMVVCARRLWPVLRPACTSRDTVSGAGASRMRTCAEHGPVLGRWRRARALGANRRAVGGLDLARLPWA
ncbi:uncharacterized protein C8Q71DRAFT_192315 [Rhodofomes roseus]|uniref:Uncharacterized protein n=1 Tax=Rhodofomes roseus TaxID=34475 RepID=A0ABQ8K7D8_9APHY|nr:uncharacterized protein C8Q71DRAFT_192315 [Rhodofomes roseus]KAH9833158.1 hypothetical protein C8Q71DRAFT_192315 [Rhodofomes roseus]